MLKRGRWVRIRVERNTPCGAREWRGGEARLSNKEGRWVTNTQEGATRVERGSGKEERRSCETKRVDGYEYPRRNLPCGAKRWRGGEALL